MIYASKTPRDLNRDPEPYLNIETRKRYRTAPAGTDYYFRYEPRPEFDPVQHNEPNPILVGLRRLIEDGLHRDLAAFYADAATYLTGGTHTLGDPIPAGASDHAREVLTRLAALS